MKWHLSEILFPTQSKILMPEMECLIWSSGELIPLKDSMWKLKIAREQRLIWQSGNLETHLVFGVIILHREFYFTKGNQLVNGFALKENWSWCQTGWKLNGWNGLPRWCSRLRTSPLRVQIMMTWRIFGHIRYNAKKFSIGAFTWRNSIRKKTYGLDYQVTFKKLFTWVVKQCINKTLILQKYFRERKDWKTQLTFLIFSLTLSSLTRFIFTDVWNLELQSRR